MSLHELKVDESDYHREWVTISKVVHIFKVLFNKEATKVLEKVNTFCDIDFQKHWQDWKRGIILDVDDCIAPHHWGIYTFNKDKINQLILLGWQIVIYSNMKNSDRYEELENMGIEVIKSPYAKPNSAWFEECVDKMWLDHTQIMMIWDNFLTDGWSIWAGIDFVKVDAINKDIWEQSIWRKVQINMRDFADRVAKLHGNID